MDWGCISRNSVGPLIEIQGTLDANRYISMILEPFLKYWRKSAVPEKRLFSCTTMPHITVPERLQLGLDGKESRS